MKIASGGATAAPEAQRRLGERLFAVLSFCLLAGIGGAQVLWGERFSGHGVGKGDSYYYLDMAQEFPRMVFGGKLDSYRIQRSLPSGIVCGALTVLGKPRDAATVVRAFATLNLALLLGTLLIWCGIARAVGLSLSGRWLGFLLLFGNVALLRVSFYSPVLTDVSGFAVSALLLLGHVTASGPLMMAALLAGAFTWPGFLFYGLALFLFPRQPLPEGQAPRRAHWIAALGASVLFLVMLRAGLRGPLPVPEPDPPPTGWGQVWLHESWVVPSVALTLAYLTFGFATLLRHRDLFRWETYWRRVELRRLALFIPLLVAVPLLAHWLGAGLPPANTAPRFLASVALQSVVRPAHSLVAHVVYFGLLPLFLLVLWPRVCRDAHGLGLGITWFVASLVLVGLTPESRQVLHGLPVLALLAVLAMEGERWPRWAAWVLTAFALLGSKVWFSMNQAGFTSKSHPFSYPAQYFWMNLGPWMTDEMYALQGSLALAALLVVVLAVRGSRRPDPAEQQLVWPSHRAVLALPVALALVALVTAIVELPARAWLARRALLAQRDPLSDATPRLGWRNRPGAEARLRRDEYDVVVRINSKGLRGPEREYAKRETVRRVLLLGGSFAEGYSVPEENTLRAVLEQRLRASGCGAVEVISGGVARYGTEQQLTLFEEEGARYRPDAVVLLFHHEDMAGALRRASAADASEIQAPDEMPARLPLNLRQPRETTHRWRRSAALRVLSNLTLQRAPAVHRTLGRWGVVDYSPPPRELWPYGLREEAVRAWRRTSELLARLAAEVRGAGAGPVLLYVPARFEVEPEAWQNLLAVYRMSPRFWNPERLAAKLEALAARLGVPLVDPRASLREGQASPVPNYFRREGLWTEAGHAHAARLLVPPLAKQLGCGAGYRHSPSSVKAAQ